MSKTSSPHLFKHVSLLSTSDVRYDGRLYIIDHDAKTIALHHVRCLGTEGRRSGDQAIAPSSSTYEFIIFRAENIKELYLKLSDGEYQELTNEILEPLRSGRPINQEVVRRVDESRSQRQSHQNQHNKYQQDIDDRNQERHSQMRRTVLQPRPIHNGPKRKVGIDGRNNYVNQNYDNRGGYNRNYDNDYDNRGGSGYDRYDNRGGGNRNYNQNSGYDNFNNYRNNRNNQQYYNNTRQYDNRNNRQTQGGYYNNQRSYVNRRRDNYYNYNNNNTNNNNNNNNYQYSNNRRQYGVSTNRPSYNDVSRRPNYPSNRNYQNYNNIRNNPRNYQNNYNNYQNYRRSYNNNRVFRSRNTEDRPKPGTGAFLTGRRLAGEDINFKQTEDFDFQDSNRKLEKLQDTKTDEVVNNTLNEDNNNNITTNDDDNNNNTNDISDNKEEKQNEDEKNKSFPTQEKQESELVYDPKSGGFFDDLVIVTEKQRREEARKFNIENDNKNVDIDTFGSLASNYKARSNSRPYRKNSNFSNYNNRQYSNYKFNRRYQQKTQQPRYVPITNRS